MSNILETIVAYKKKELALRQTRVPVNELEKAPGFAYGCLSLEGFIRNPLKTGIIAEFKRCSPSKGTINETATVEEVTTKYAAYGASGLSILTDEHFFKGSTEDLEKARSLNQVPILRKDFIIDPYQVIEAKAMGADVMLLISECLTKAEVGALAKQARELGMGVLLEMHTEAQLDKISPDVTLVGINNRDLTTFQVDIARSIRLAEKLPLAMPKIAESGIDDPQTIRRLKEAGFDGFLMGEYFMKQVDPGEAFNEFVKKVSGPDTP